MRVENVLNVYILPSRNMSKNLWRTRDLYLVLVRSDNLIHLPYYEVLRLYSIN